MGKKALYFSLQELQRKAMKAWRTYAEDYRNLMPTYQELLAKKRWLKENEKGYKSMPLRKINKPILDELPEIQFFDIVDEEEALDYICELEYGELNYLVVTIYSTINDRAYRTIKARITDYEHEIKYFKRSTSFGYDPTYPTSSGQRPNPRINSKRSNGLDD